jgi:hypothetical protein
MHRKCPIGQLCIERSHRESWNMHRRGLFGQLEYASERSHMTAGICMRKGPIGQLEYASVRSHLSLLDSRVSSLTERYKYLGLYRDSSSLTSTSHGPMRELCLIMKSKGSMLAWGPRKSFSPVRTCPGPLRGS